MKFPSVTVLLACGLGSPSLAFSIGNRRDFFGQIATTVAIGAQQAHATLIDDYGSDPTKIDVPASSPTPPSSVTANSESLIEPNLRSNYYYPTNKKRYLPRIQRCTNALPGVAECLSSQDWQAVETFASEVADDTILPLKLYTSSLTGGGTHVKVSYTGDMYECADQFETQHRQLVQAIASQDTVVAATALEGMAQALARYRAVAGLTEDMSDLPSVDDIRRAASRTQFEGEIKNRDKSLAMAAR